MPARGQSLGPHLTVSTCKPRRCGVRPLGRSCSRTEGWGMQASQHTGERVGHLFGISGSQG